jgi:large subunit ribosomal protein L30
MAAIKVRLVRGLSGCPADHRLTVQGLGLKKMNSEKVLPDTAATMGMIHKVGYLVEWERVDAPAPQGRKARKQAKAQ